jgi:hypothetical protein
MISDKGLRVPLVVGWGFRDRLLGFLNTTVSEGLVEAPYPIKPMKYKPYSPEMALAMLVPI